VSGDDDNRHEDPPFYHYRQQIQSTHSRHPCVRYLEAVGAPAQIRLCDGDLAVMSAFVGAARVA
jgi:hypothetical protein